MKINLVPRAKLLTGRCLVQTSARRSTTPTKDLRGYELKSVIKILSLSPNFSPWITKCKYKNSTLIRQTFKQRFVDEITTSNLGYNQYIGITPRRWRLYIRTKHL